MTTSDDSPTLPTQIADAVLSIPKGLVPGSLKALDRLVGAAVDIPVAWLAQQKAKVDAQTSAYTLVEAAIGKAVAMEAGADRETVQRALDVLVRKQYRKQKNQEAVAEAMLEDLSSEGSPDPPDSPGIVDDDWLNVFERYAGDASTDRMQKLWGRVLAGEIRKPGKYSMRTLRFLSEFSQSDALAFADFCQNAFGDCAPKSLVKPNGQSDIRNLISLESAGLIQGASSGYLNLNTNIGDDGRGFIIESGLGIMLEGAPKSTVKQEVMALTPLGQELMNLVPSRDAIAAARVVAQTYRGKGLRVATIIRLEGSQYFSIETIQLEQDSEETERD